MNKEPRDEYSPEALFHHDLAMFITMLVMLSLAVWVIQHI
jgi:hypothetical protein